MDIITHVPTIAPKFVAKKGYIWDSLVGVKYQLAIVLKDWCLIGNILEVYAGE